MKLTFATILCFSSFSALASALPHGEWSSDYNYEYWESSEDSDSESGRGRTHTSTGDSGACVASPWKHEATWDYHSNFDKVNKQCHGKHQSPIDISTLNSDHFFTKDSCAEPLTFNGFDSKPENLTFVNNGHTAELMVSQDPPAYISGGLLHGDYIFEQLHFHWGSIDTQGSEHTFDEKRQPLEMHIVTWKSEYNTFAESLKHHDGLAVFSVLFKLGSESSPAMADLTSLLYGITNPESKIECSEQASGMVHPLRDFLPLDTYDFFRYTGSLTTPPCTEVVTWSVFKTFADISENDLNKFRQLKDSSALPLVDNFRQIQRFW